VKFLSRYSLLIVDEIGYPPLGSNGGNLFFQLVNVCYERYAKVMMPAARASRRRAVRPDDGAGLIESNTISINGIDASSSVRAPIPPARSLWHTTSVEFELAAMDGFLRVP
jgi:hypothetical protein